MNRTVLSLCLFGAALATANILIMQRPATCPSAGAAIVAAPVATSPAPVAAAHSAPTPPATAESSQASKDQAVAPVPAKDEAAKPAAPKDLDQTGSVDQTPQQQSQKSALAPQTKPGDSLVNAGEGEQWAEVVLAAKAHSAASVSSPTVRNYRVGTRLKVVARKSGWIEIVDPITADRSWIFEKYLIVKEGSGKKQADGPAPAQRTAQAEPNVPDDPNLMVPAQPQPNARPYPRKQGSRRGYRYFWPPAGLAIRIYPGW
jgi:hypothetical protein